MWTPNSQSRDCIERLDPSGNGGYEMHQEVCLGPMMSEPLGVEAAYALGAYGNIVPVANPESGRTLRLIAFQTTIRGDKLPTWNGYDQGAIYAVRTSD